MEVNGVMRADQNPAHELDEFDGGESELFGIEPAGTDPPERVEEVEPEADEDLLEAELGERDALVADDPELDELDDNFDPDQDEVDDEFEMSLIQDLGIDLDAPDDLAANLELGTGFHDDDPLDDEVAA
jgi:hypothetical protein